MKNEKIIEQNIKQRRSVRKYINKPIPECLIERIIESANWAPSACNRQTTRYVIIDDKIILNKIVDLGGASFIKNAPVAILVITAKRNNNLEYQDEIQSGASAIQNMLLTATSYKIGSCWICNLPSVKSLLRLLKINLNYRVIGLVTLGYYNFEPKPVLRKCDLKDIISRNNDGKFIENSGKNNIFISLIIQFYRKLPKLKVFKMIADKFIKKFEN